MKNRIGANEHIEHGQELYKKYREKGKNGEHTTDVLHTKYCKIFKAIHGIGWICVCVRLHYWPMFCECVALYI